MQKTSDITSFWISCLALLRSKPFWIAATNALLLFVILRNPIPGDTHGMAATPFVVALPLIGACWAFTAILRDWSNGRHDGRWSAFAFGLACTAFSLGIIANVYYGIRYHGTHFPPSWVNAIFLSIQPIIVIGILCLPMRPVPAAMRMRILLDSIMIMTAVTVILWKFLLGPVLMQSGSTTSDLISRVVSPVSNLMVFVSILAISSHLYVVGSRSVLRVLTAAFALLFITNVVFSYETLHHTFRMGTVNDVICTVGYMLLGLVASWLPSSLRSAAEHETIVLETKHAIPEIVLWRTLLPYALLPFVAAVVINTVRGSDGHLVQGGVYFGAAALLGLMLFRQITAIFETRQLYDVLQNAYRDLSVNNEQLHQAKVELAAQNDELHSVRAVLQVQNLSLAEANALLETLAVTDGLTGLKNHRAFQERLESAWRRAEATGETFALLLLDVDHFKRFNDTWGHPAGDEVLKSVARAISGEMRAGEFAARYGGEEFAVLLPAEGISEAQECAERIRVAIESITGIQQSITASIGVAELGPGISTGAELLARADAALYCAKADGRNCVRSGANTRALGNWAA